MGTIPSEQPTAVVGRVISGMPDNAWYKDREGVRRQFVWETWGGMRRNLTMTTVFFVMLLVIAGVIVIVGLVGLVLLIVGIAKKRTALWVCGLVAMILAGMALLVGVPVGLYLGAGLSSRDDVAVMDTVSAIEAEPHEGGCSITHENGRVMVHVEGIKIEVVDPGSGSSHSSSQSSGSLPSGSRDARHEIGVGNVEILVETHGGRTTLTVNGRPCGLIHPGDSVVITPEREVLVNDERRLP